jgi:hypothetical protein
MVQTKGLNTLKFADKLAEAPEYEPLSALSTDASSCDESIFSDRNRKLERYTRSKDRLVFCLNIINMMVTCVLLTKDPQYYVYWNALIVPALILHRVHDYYSKGWHFYMVDFCYIVNFLVIASTLFFPKSEAMTMISFGLSLGPLTFSLWYFRNTLAFTSLDKITSVTIHSQAPLTMFLVHWHDKVGNFATTVNGISPFGLGFLSKWYGSIILFYGIWAVLYYLTIFVVFGKHITRRKLETLYSYSMTDPKTSRKLLSRGARWSKLLFMFGHFRFVIALSTVAMALYFSYWLGLVWLIGFHAVIIYNGATYCIDFHSTRYEKQFIGKAKKF